MLEYGCNQCGREWGSKCPWLNCGEWNLFTTKYSRTYN